MFLKSLEKESYETEFLLSKSLQIMNSTIDKEVFLLSYLH